jgi:CRP-like cAMP-binding protein
MYWIVSGEVDVLDVLGQPVGVLGKGGMVGAADLFFSPPTEGPEPTGESLASALVDGRGAAGAAGLRRVAAAGVRARSARGRTRCELLELGVEDLAGEVRRLSRGDIALNR